MDFDGLLVLDKIWTNSAKSFPCINWFNLLKSKMPVDSTRQRTCFETPIICTQIKWGHVPSVFPKLVFLPGNPHGILMEKNVPPLPCLSAHHRKPMEIHPLFLFQTTCSKRSRTREAPIPAKISTNSEALMLKKGTPAFAGKVRLWDPWYPKQPFFNGCFN